MGAAPAAQILAVRAFDAKRAGAEGTTFNILAGLDWAAARGARIINMSFAGPRDPAIARSLAAAHAKGIVLVAAGGNAGPQSPPLFPASDPNVIAVTATDAQDDLFSAANRGSHIAVAAPGVDILLPAPNAGYQVTSGTSFAAAEVSGAIALLLERKPDLDPAAVRRILVDTAKDLGPRGADPLFGAGLVDAYQAVVSLQPATAEARPQAAAGPAENGGKINSTQP
jgi:subtilisin family serine protease